MNEWAVYRLDYHSNEYLVEKGLSRTEADQLAEEYIAKGHHQHYWVDKEPDALPDFDRMLTNMLAAGSPPAMAVRVLLSLGAAFDTCIELLQTSAGLSSKEASAIITKITSEP